MTEDWVWNFPSADQGACSWPGEFIHYSCSHTVSMCWWQRWSHLWPHESHLVFQRCIPLMGALLQDNFFSHLIMMSSFLLFFPCTQFQANPHTTVVLSIALPCICTRVSSKILNPLVFIHNFELQSMLLDLRLWFCKTEGSWIQLCFSLQKDWLGHFLLCLILFPLSLFSPSLVTALFAEWWWMTLNEYGRRHRLLCQRTTSLSQRPGVRFLAANLTWPLQDFSSNPLLSQVQLTCSYQNWKHDTDFSF